ncbi:hypothetical protein BDV36DRAFT_304930 [Aspergillus pseudocaelatus]|uniref:Zn(2)-C6 fungal-type domain-containing protein n=1 Tax=Aspergillus pseudocaelatus TaxID=1825620 RepID=A0ABQ6WWI4_9EURO|nr:hypothetical protein BDV36DRAFT_304930 [Aspergillus pseudocaelatus]
MADYDPPPRPTGYRLRMACQECRKRKIKCDGGKPCNICQRRGTSCLYRDIVRRRMRRHQNNKHEDAPTKMPKLPSGICEGENAQSPNEELSASNIPHDQGSTVKYSFNHGVSATDTASPLTTVQLYYGSTSQFAFMHEFHQEMMPDRADQSNETRGGVMETGPGLDMFNFRPIFFGRPFETDGASGKPGDGGTGELVVLIDKDLAKTFLERYLSTSYYLATFRPAENFRRHLESLYSPVPGSEIDTWSRLVIFMALALGSLGTTHCEWGDILFQRVNDTITSMSDVVNLSAVQISLYMITQFQTEQGRFNSSFLHLGTAARKAISAGLHKEPPANSDDGSESVEERRDTFWSLYFYETWVTFHLGRPSAISPRDINIKPSANPFLQTLVTLCQVIHRSVDGINGQHEKSLLQMWHIARSVMDNLRTYDACMRRALGTGLSSKPRPGSLGVQQTILITLYYHAILLTYRPFLLFRRRWHRTPHDPAQAAGAGAQMPNWLNEACNCALNAACRTIEYLCEAALTNELVREARYHGYFLSSACFVLAYNIVHGENESSVPSYIPWIHAAIRCLESMRPGDPINTFIAAIRNILTKISSLCQLRQSAMKDKLFIWIMSVK